MPQLPYNPMKHRALQAGADHYLAVSGNTLRDVIAEVDLVTTGTAAPAADLGVAVNIDLPARTWVDQDLKLEPGAFLSPGTVLPGGNFTLFGRFGVQALSAAGSRTLMAVEFGNGDTLELYMYSDDPDEPSRLMWYWTAFGYGASGGVVSFDIPIRASAEYVYAGMFTSNGETFAYLALPGQKPAFDRLYTTKYNAGTQTTSHFRPSGTLTLLNIGGAGGITGVDAFAGLDYRRKMSDRTLRVSSLFTLPRGSSPAEMIGWTNLLETGRTSAAEVLAPIDNSEGVLDAAITETDTLLTPTGGTLKFVAPGPYEEGRLTILDSADPAVFEVCALIGNADGQLEVRRGADGTAPRAWTAGARICGMLTNAHFRAAGAAEQPMPSRVVSTPPVTLGEGITFVGSAYSEVIGDNAYAMSLTRTTLIGYNAYAEAVSDSVVMGASAYAENTRWSIVLGRWTYVDAADYAVALGYSAGVDTCNNAVALGDSSYVYASNTGVAIGSSSQVRESVGGIALGASSYLNGSAGALALGGSAKLHASPDTVLLGRGRKVYNLPGVLVAPGPAVLPRIYAAADLSDTLPAHAKRATYESAIFSAPGQTLTAQTISFVLPTGVRVFLDEIGFMVDGAPTGSFDGMTVSVKNELGEYLAQNVPLAGAIEAFGRWRTPSFAKDKGASTVELVIETAPTAATGTIQAYIKGLFVQTA